MLVAVDVQYGERAAAAAGVAFAAWSDAAPFAERTRIVRDPADYVPGQFWRRELPCIRVILEAFGARPSCVVIDGYVWLDAEQPGLGAHLFEALGGDTAVVGVAKTAFRGSAHAEVVRRGRAERPLYVTASGMTNAEAADAIRRMHGAHRLPTLLGRADRLARAALTAHGRASVG